MLFFSQNYILIVYLDSSEIHKNHSLYHNIELPRYL